MDLIRIFIDTAFSKVADVFLKEVDALTRKTESLMFNEGMFVDVCRRHHPELSDDQIRMIYHLYKDEWAYTDEELERTTIDEDHNLTPDIFNVIFRFSSEMLRLHNREPLVKFNHLFRWREVTLNIGEDLLVAAYHAYKNRNKPFKRDLEDAYLDTEVDGIDFCAWPTILHNDNPNLKYLFLKLRLTELHSHLYASTDNFSISWVALMNRIKERKDDFDKIGKIQDESRYKILSRDLYSYVILAGSIRLNLWRKINGRESFISTNLNEIEDNMDKIAEDLQNEIFKEYHGEERLDYVSFDKVSPLGVIGGERKFLYCVLRRILSDDDGAISFLFYRYLLAKNKLRSFLVQVNSNKGFANFKRFQDLKTVFLKGKYATLVSRLAVWEASEFNYTDSFETRIAPANNFQEAKDWITFEVKNISQPYSDKEKANEPEWSFLFHFIKRPENIISADIMRDGVVRKKVRLQSVILKNLLSPELWQSAGQSCLSRLKGIDAASSEIGCRPEIFSQAFRYLKDAGYAATFHAGEDFYDIADGLRAIQEAIDFLGLEAGDRIGHALALGLDSDEFYRERHNYIALPVQWMLDNVVWLYFKSREANVVMEPGTEHFLLSIFRSLVRRIGYEERNSEDKIEITDYYQSMKLRGDAPEIYVGKDVTTRRGVSQSWCHYDRIDSSEVVEIRRWNDKSKELFWSYLRDDKIRKRGVKIASFQVPSGYPKLIRDIQEEMIKDISKRQLGIECCPSSNYKIGYFKRYDQHPIFRFFPINEERTHYPLPVTVNTDDLGVFSTSLPNEFSLLTLALMKMKDKDGNHIYSTREVYDWIERIIRNNEKFAFTPIVNNEMKFYSQNDL